MNLSPLPVQKFFDNDGRPLAGGKLFTYAAGTTTKLGTFTDAVPLGANTNPIILNFRGEANIWLDPTLSYKFVLAPSTDTDPPTNPIWTVDRITGSPAITDNAALDLGSANTVQLTIPALASTPAVFDRVVWKSNQTNTGAMTITVNGGPAKALDWQDGGALIANAVLTGGMYEAIYNGVVWHLQGPTIGPFNKALTNEVAAGVTPENGFYAPGDTRRWPLQEFDNPELVQRYDGRLGNHSAGGLRRFLGALEEQVDGSFAELRVHCYGSSVGNLPLSNGLTPGQHFFNELLRVVDANNRRNLTFYQGSIGGHAMADLDADITAAIAADGGNPRLAIIMMGMNDGQVNLYGAGQTYPGVYTLLRAGIRRLQNLGCDVIVCTSVHIDTDNANAGGFYTMNPAIPQTYPTAVAAPVSQAAMIPSFGNSILTGDYLGTGQAIEVDARFLRVNEAMRRAAYDCDAIVADVEFYDFETIAAYGVTNANLAISRYGSPSQVVHPQPFGMDQSYGRCLNDLARSLRYCGGSDQRGANNFARIGLNIEGQASASLHVQQESASVPFAEFRNSSAALLAKLDETGALSVLNSAGTRSFTLDPNGFSNATALLTLLTESGRFKLWSRSAFNVTGNQDVLLEAESAGVIIMRAFQNGIGRQVSVRGFTVTGTTVTQAVIYDNAVAVCTFGVNGLNFRMAFGSPNSEYQLAVLALK